MHAVAVEKASSPAPENGASKMTKKKSKTNRKQQSQKSSGPVPPPAENHNVKGNKNVNHCTNNGTAVSMENGQDDGKSLSEKLDGEGPIKENGCAESDHHGEENGEVAEIVNSKKPTRSKNQKKRNQKGTRSSIENGTTKIDKEPSSACEDSDKLCNNNNIIEKSSPIANGTDDCPVLSTQSNHVIHVTDGETPPSSSSSSPQSKSSSTSPSSATSSSQKSLSLSPGTSTSAPSPPPSSSNEQISNKTNESQGLELGKEVGKESATSSPDTTIPAATAPIAPNGEDGAVGGIDRSNIVIEYKQYESELQMQDIMRLIQSELSEPYSIYTYRYFIYNWPKLCFLAAHGDEYVGAIVCKLDMHMNVKRGYIAMLAVKKEYRKLKIGTTLVEKAIEAMLADDADEVVLETEMKNTPALRLYENLGFVRDKRLFRYYLNGVDALRLKLWFR